MNDPGSSPEPGHSPEHEDALVPHLDPDVEETVQNLLRSIADPGPMPEAVASRIGDALATAHAQAATTPDDHSVLLPLVRQRQRPSRWLAVAAIAAAAAVVAVGASALHVSTDPGRSAIAVAGAPRASESSVPARPATSSTPSAEPAVHIQVSPTAYTAATLTDQVALLVDAPGQPLDVLAAEAPSLGPIATEIGLASCLDALDVGTYEEVSADLATYEGRPAAVIVVGGGSDQTAYVVERSCTTGSPGLLAGPVPMP